MIWKIIWEVILKLVSSPHLHHQLPNQTYHHLSCAVRGSLVTGLSDSFLVPTKPLFTLPPGWCFKNTITEVSYLFIFQIILYLPIAIWIKNPMLKHNYHTDPAPASTLDLIPS